MLTCGAYDGSSRVTMPAGITGMNVGTGDFSIELWYNAQGGPIFSNRSSDLYDFSIISDYGDGLPGTIWVRDHTPDSELMKSVRAADGEWHYLVLTRTAGYYDLYIDAVRTYLGAKEYITVPPYQDIPITDFNAAQYGFEKLTGASTDDAGGIFGFSGLIDEFAFYGTALSQAQVDGHYSAAGGVPPPPVPEPGTLVLLATGMVVFAGYVRRKKFMIYDL